MICTETKQALRALKYFMKSEVPPEEIQMWLYSAGPHQVNILKELGECLGYNIVGVSSGKIMGTSLDINKELFSTLGKLAETLIGSLNNSDSTKKEQDLPKNSSREIPIKAL